MRILTRLGFIVIALGSALAACGDNSNECDPDTTMNVDGRCVGAGGVTCADGTILVDGKCEIDPSSCQDGTVLVGGACVDPGHVTVDLEEAAEPNGLGIFEQSADPAGEIVLKPAGQSFVIHGKIVPFQDDDDDGQTDPDIDTYFVVVETPTMLTISADGLHGLAAGFVSLANVASTDPMSDWLRFGVNLTGDTSQRQLFLPVPGIYLLAVGDSRTLLLSGAAAGAEEGKPELEYYISIEQQTVTPTALTVTNGVATSTGMRQPGEVKLFSVALGEGINTATLESPNEQIQSSVVVTRTRTSTTSLRGIGDGDPAEVSTLGIRTGDTSLVIADSVLDYANQPTEYELTVEVGGAGALSTSGGDVAQPGSETDFSIFHYDVGADGLTVGIDLEFDKPVVGALVDESFSIFSFFTFDPSFGFAFNETFQSYKGLLKHATPGRYYFFVYDPIFDPDDPEDITATSTYAGIAPPSIVKGTPLVDKAINTFESNPFVYTPDIATDPWQTFTGSGTGTGVVTAAFFAPNAIGRMDTLVNQCGAPCNDRPVPLYTHTYAEAGQTRGRILIPNAALNTFFVTVNTATVTGSPTFSLDFKAQEDVTDLTVAAGMTANSNGKVLDATTTIQRFIVRTNANNGLDISATPDTTLDTQIQRVNADEGSVGPVVDNGGVGDPDTVSDLVQDAGGFMAFTVTAVAATTGMFDFAATATPPPYATAAGSTAFADACVNGTAVTFERGAAIEDADEGLSATIAAPAGFDYFGAPVTNLVMASNGFVSFQAGLACPGTTCFFGNADMPSAAAPNAIIAPYWDDLVITEACQETIGTKLILQWEGNLFLSTTTIAMQVILDGANDTIEFVYGTGHVANGGSATIGLENQAGNRAIKLSFNAMNPSPNTLFTPQ